MGVIAWHFARQRSFRKMFWLVEPGLRLSFYSPYIEMYRLWRIVALNTHLIGGFSKLSKNRSQGLLHMHALNSICAHFLRQHFTLDRRQSRLMESRISVSHFSLINDISGEFLSYSIISLSEILFNLSNWSASLLHASPLHNSRECISFICCTISEVWWCTRQRLYAYVWTKLTWILLFVHCIVLYHWSTAIFRYQHNAEQRKIIALVWSARFLSGKVGVIIRRAINVFHRW